MGWLGRGAECDSMVGKPRWQGALQAVVDSRVFLMVSRLCPQTMKAACRSLTT